MTVDHFRVVHDAVLVHKGRLPPPLPKVKMSQSLSISRGQEGSFENLTR